MRKGWQSVNVKIAQIAKEYDGKSVSQLFKALSKVGGKKFRGVMKRIHRSIQKYG